MEFERFFPAPKTEFGTRIRTAANPFSASYSTRTYVVTILHATATLKPEVKTRMTLQELFDLVVAKQPTAAETAAERLDEISAEIPRAEFYMMVGGPRLTKHQREMVDAFLERAALELGIPLDLFDVSNSAFAGVARCYKARARSLD